MIKLNCFIKSFLVLGTTVFFSCEQEPPKTTNPNILIIVADDLGYSDLGCFGSEIKTPNLDSLASQGYLLSQFYATPACSPTRATLLTGLDPHLVGLGTMIGEQDSNQLGQIAYKGVLDPSVKTIPQLLQEQGYFTTMTGKWHLGADPHLLPSHRGFQRSFSLMQGGASHFSDRTGLVEGAVAKYVEDGNDAEIPNDFYSTNFYTDQLIQYLEENQPTGQPFFAYLSYTAPHWPLQVPDEYLDRYRGVYDKGYESIKLDRLKKQLDLDIIADTLPPTQLSFVDEWALLPEAEQEMMSRKMEIYAGMVECMDSNIGRLFEYLKSTNQYDQTLIVFLSDNGPEGNPIANMSHNKEWIPRAFDNSINNMGKVNSYIFTGPGWAQASATPFNWFKTFVYEGGIRVPCIIKPTKTKLGQPTLVKDPIDIMDLSATILNETGCSQDTIASFGMKGRNLLDKIENPKDSSKTFLMVKELFGRRSVRKGNWKIVWQGPPYGSGQWQLFNLALDPGEQSDVSARYPEILASLVEDWDQYVVQNQIILPTRDMGYANEELSK